MCRLTWRSCRFFLAPRVSYFDNIRSCFDFHLGSGRNIVFGTSSTSPTLYDQLFFFRHINTKSAMADVPMSNGNGMGTSRKMSFGLNGKLNGTEGKTPFLIGVSGGTASGKVIIHFPLFPNIRRAILAHEIRELS